MHPTMNSFSDITAIDIAEKLTVDVQLKSHGHCTYTAYLNNQRLNYCATRINFDLFDTVNLTIELLDFDEGSSGVEIQMLKINGLEVLPKYQHLATGSTNYIDKLGIWSMHIPAAFYTWYHEISGQGFIA